MDSPQLDPLASIFQECQYSIVIPRADVNIKDQQSEYWFGRQDLHRSSAYFGIVLKICRPYSPLFSLFTFKILLM